ncbi:uncharacterized protein [Typha latifolia]|uniref:uncharacterized protein n=1 Tax=Typha latifolia TaxID=4733 RepID=UPI003C2E16D4
MMNSGVSLSDMVLGFFEEVEEQRQEDGNDEDGDGDESISNAMGNRAFWEMEHQLLQEALDRNSSAESRIRRDTEEAVRSIESEGLVCSCLNRMAKEKCRNCFLRHIAQRLRDAGYNSAICKSKWRRSPDIPSGEHSYVDVVVDSKNGKRSPIRVVIELNFRAEFEMARATLEYNSLVGRLPEMFVGKSEKMKNVVKIVCAAAKKCMKDNKMHMGPWRKHKYMQSKWLSTPERITPGPLVPAMAVTDRPPKIRASMLTFDLHCTAVEVV